VRTDVPRYHLWRDGERVAEVSDLRAVWRDDLVTFALGCSFSFEHALLAAGIPLRHVSQGRNVAMYRTNIPTRPVGVFQGPPWCRCGRSRPPMRSAPCRSPRAHAAGAWRSHPYRRPGPDRHRRHPPARLWRRGGHPRRRAAGVLGLRRHAQAAIVAARPASASPMRRATCW
jgi:hypothetical protein